MFDFLTKQIEKPEVLEVIDMNTRVKVLKVNLTEWSKRKREFIVKRSWIVVFKRETETQFEEFSAFPTKKWALDEGRKMTRHFKDKPAPAPVQEIEENVDLIDLFFNGYKN